MSLKNCLFLQTVWLCTLQRLFICFNNLLLNRSEHESMFELLKLKKSLSSFFPWYISIYSRFIKLTNYQVNFVSFCMRSIRINLRVKILDLQWYIFLIGVSIVLLSNLLIAQKYLHNKPVSSLLDKEISISVKYFCDTRTNNEWTTSSVLRPSSPGRKNFTY